MTATQSAAQPEADGGLIGVLAPQKQADGPWAGPSRLMQLVGAQIAQMKDRDFGCMAQYIQVYAANRPARQ